MKILICLTVLLSVASMSVGFDLFAGVAKQATEMMKQGMEIGKQGVEMGTQMVSQGVEMGTQMANQGLTTSMQIFNQATASVPFMDAIESAQKIVEGAADTATGFQEQMMDLFQKGADEAGKMAQGVAEGAAGMAEGAAGMAAGTAAQTQQMFMEGMKQMGALQAAGAPKADYMNLLNKMKGPAGMF